MSESKDRTRTVRILARVILGIGVVFMLAGVFTWAAVSAQLEAEEILVSDDATRFAGQPVNGPLTAYEQANVINEHSLAATGGKTYAELHSDDPARQTAMTASFLRASLYTSVVAFGVAAMAFGIGVVFVLIGFALLQVVRKPEVAAGGA